MSETRSLVDATAPSRFRDAALAELDRDFVRAADIYAALGFRAVEAEARLDAARDLVAAGDRTEGEVELQKALAFYLSVGATFFVERGEALLRREKTA